MSPQNKTKEEQEERYSLVEVPTETGTFIKDNEKNELFDDKKVFVEILNILENIRKAVA